MIRLKDPDAVLDYAIDWSDWLGTADFISTSMWTDPGEIVTDGDDFDATSATIWLSGGVSGNAYEFNNTITTDRGRTEQQSLVVVVNEEALVAGVNSFGSYTEIAKEVALGDMGFYLREQKRMTQESILLQAWRNIALLQLHLETSTGLLYTNVYDMDEISYVTLPERTKRQLRQAQIIESDHLLGINPVEDRRRMGILSDKSGETGHFFRTAKPLDLPVYRETARHLKGLIVNSLHVGRA